MRSLVLTALLSTVVHAASLSGTLKTPDNNPLAGAGVSLAVAGLSTVTAADGSWQLDGTTGLARATRTELRATRHLSVVNGRISLDWNGRDIAGRHGSTAPLTVTSGMVVGRAVGADDTLVFTWHNTRIGAIPVRLDSSYSLGLRLDTAATPASQSVQVRAVRYASSGTQGISILLTSPTTALVQPRTAISNSIVPQVFQDSLSLRLFVRSTDTLAGTQILLTGTGMQTLPLRFQDAVAVRYDICQNYDSSGFNKPCDDPRTGLNWSWGTLSSAVSLLSPTRIEGTYDLASGTWIYAIDLPLGPTSLTVGGKLYVDFLLVHRTEYGKPFSSYQKTLVDTLKPYLPSRTFPAVGDIGWWDAYTNAAPHAIVASDSAAQSLDWSFTAHSVRNGAPVDFPGLPKATSNSEIAAILLFGGQSDLNPWTRLAPNPYICVYRKGKLVSGYPPVPGRD